MKDLLPEKYKIMTKDINTINSKGISINKSLQSIINTNIMLPKDKYLFPTLGVSVKDNFLGLFNWGNDLWGNFDIPLEQHCIDTLQQYELAAEKREKEIANVAFFSAKIKSKITTGKDLEMKKQQDEAMASNVVRPVHNKTYTSMVNDV